MAPDALRLSPDPKHLQAVPETRVDFVLVAQKEELPIFEPEDALRQRVIHFCKALDDPSKTKQPFPVNPLKVKKGCSRRPIFIIIAEKDMGAVEVAMVEPSLMHSAGQFRDFFQEQPFSGFRLRPQEKLRARFKQLLKRNIRAEIFRDDKGLDPWPPNHSLAGSHRHRSGDIRLPEAADIVELQKPLGQPSPPSEGGTPFLKPQLIRIVPLQIEVSNFAVDGQRDSGHCSDADIFNHLTTVIYEHPVERVQAVSCKDVQKISVDDQPVVPLPVDGSRKTHHRHLRSMIS